MRVSEAQLHDAVDDDCMRDKQLSRSNRGEALVLRRKLMQLD